MAWRPQRRGTLTAITIGVLLLLYLFFPATAQVERVTATAGEGQATRTRVRPPPIYRPPAPSPKPAARPDPEPADDAPEVPDEPELAIASIAVRYEDGEGYVIDDAWGGLTGCEMTGFTRHPDGFDAEVEEGSVCRAVAYRRDGLLQVRAEPVEFEAVDGTEVMLVFPSGRTGGIGVQFQPTEGGVMVIGVMPGTPAAEAGLQPGDVIVSVGGELTDGLSNEDFVDAMTGPEGTEVEFEVAYETDEGPLIELITLTRAYLSG